MKKSRKSESFRSLGIRLVLLGGAWLAMGGQVWGQGIGEGLTLAKPAFQSGFNPQMYALETQNKLNACKRAALADNAALRAFTIESEIERLFGKRGKTKSKSGIPKACSYTGLECVDSPPVPENLACDSMKKDGAFDDDVWLSYVRKTQAWECSQDCKKKALEAIRLELDCVSKVLADVQQTWDGELRKDFTTHIQKFQTAVAEIKAHQADRTRQLEEVKRKLDGDAGTEGLLALQKEGAEGINKGPEVTGSLLGLIQEARNGRKQALELQESMIHGRAKKYFMQETYRSGAAYAGCSFREKPKDTGAAWWSTPSKKEDEGRAKLNQFLSVSFYEHVLCYYNSLKLLDGNNRVDESFRAKAKEETSQLQAVLKAHLDLVNEDFQLAASAQQATEQSGQGLGKLNLAALGNDLERFNLPRFQVATRVTEQLGLLIARSEKEVKAEAKRLTTPIGSVFEVSRKADDASSSKVGEFIRQSGSFLERAMRTLSMENVVFDAQRCEGVSKPQVLRISCSDPENLPCRDSIFDAQENCVKEIDARVTALVKGQGPFSQFSIQFASDLPTNEFTVQCRGLNGCVTALHKVKTKLDQLAGKGGTLEKLEIKYVQKANLEVDSYAQKVQTALGGPSGVLNERLKFLNGKLSQLGEAFKFKPSEKQKLEKGEDGIYQVPGDPFAFVAGNTTPPLPRLDAEESSEVTKSLANAGKKVGDDLDKASGVLGNLALLPRKCFDERVEKNIGSLKPEIDKLLTCNYQSSICADFSAAPFVDVTKLVTAIAGGDVGAAFDSGPLMNGMTRLCDPSSGTSGPTTLTGVCDQAVTNIKTTLTKLSTEKVSDGSRAKSLR